GCRAGAVGPDDPVEGAARDVQGELVDHFGAVEGLAQTAQGQRRALRDRGIRGDGGGDAGDGSLGDRAVGGGGGSRVALGGERVLGVHEFTLVRSVNGTAPPRGEEGPDL